MTRKRTWTILAIVLLVVTIGAVATGYWYVQQQVDPDRLAAQLEEVLDRQVTVDRSRLSFRGRLTLRGVTVWHGRPDDERTTPGGDEPPRYVEADRIRLNFAWLELLRGQPKINTIHVSGHRWWVHRDEEGEMDLVEAIRELIEKRPDPEADPVDYDRIRFTDGRFHLSDARLEREASFRLARAEVLSPREESRGSFTLNGFGLEEGMVSVRGTWETDPFRFDLDPLEIEDFDLQPYLALLPRDDEGQLWLERSNLSGRLDRLTWNEEGLNYSGEFQLEGNQFGPMFGPLLDERSIIFSLDGVLERDTGRFRGEADPLTVAGLPVRLEWDFSSLAPAEGHIRGTSEDLPVSSVMDRLPAEWTADLESTSGRVDFSLQTLFEEGEGTTTGELSLSDGEVRFVRDRRNWPDLSDMEGRLEFVDGRARMNRGRARVGELGLTVEDLELSPPWGDPEVRALVRFDPVEVQTVRRMAEDLEWVQPIEELTVGGGLESGTVEVGGSFLEPEYEGTFRVGELRVDHPRLPETIEFGAPVEFQARNDEVTLPAVTGRMAGGDLSLQGRMVRVEDTWSLNFEAESRGAPVDRMVRRYVREDGVWPSAELSGSVNRARLDVRGRLPEPDLSARVEARDLGVRTRQGEFEAVEVEFTYQDERVTVHRFSGGMTGTPSRFEGEGWMELPFDRNHPLELRISTREFPLAMLMSLLPEPFSGKNVQYGGTLDLEDVWLGGTLMNPRADGLVRLRNGSVRWDPEVEPIDELELEVVLDDSRLHLEEGTGQLEEEPFESSADILVEEGTLTVREGTFLRAGWPEVHEMEGRVRFGEEGLNLSSFQIRLGDLVGLFDELLISPPWEDPHVDGRMGIESARVEEIRRILKELELVDLPEDLVVSGLLEGATVGLQGRLWEPEISGDARLIDVEADHPLLPAALAFDQLNLTMRSNSVTLEPAVGRLAGGRVDIGGRLVRDGSTWSWDVDGEATNVPADGALYRYQQYTENEIVRLRVEGNLGRTSLRLRGTVEEPEIYGELEADGMRIWDERKEGGLENVELRLIYRDGRLELSRITGRTEVEESWFGITGEVPFPFDPSVEWSLDLDGEGLPVGLLAPWLPDTLYEEELEYGGFFDLEAVTLRGTPEHPEVDGTVRLREGRFVHDPAVDPVEDIEVLLALEYRRIRVEEGSGRLGNIPFRVHGEFRFEETWRPDLTLFIEQARASELMSWVSRLPEEEWMMEGSSSLTLLLSGLGEDFEVSGSFQAPELVWSGARFRQLEGDLGLTPDLSFFQTNQLQVFDGTVDARLELFRREVPRRYHVVADMREVEMGELLGWLTGDDHPYRGRLRGSLDIDSSMDEPYLWSGESRVRGEELDFRGVRAFEQLSVILNSSLSRAVETGVVGFLRGLLRLNPREAMTRLRSLISDQATTRFNEGTIDIEWSEGRGEVDFLLRNDEVRLEGRGWIESDGGLDVTMQVVPRAPVLNRIERDWLRGGLSGGFPELRVTGSLQEPEFDTDGLRTGLLRLLPF